MFQRIEGLFAGVHFVHTRTQVPIAAGDTQHTFLLRGVVHCLRQDHVAVFEIFRSVRAV